MQLPLTDGHLLIDNSSIEKLRCFRMWEYSEMRRRSLATSKAGRNFGSCLHTAWAVRYRQAGANAVTAPVTAAQHEAMRQYLESAPQPEDDFRTFEHACRVIDAYNSCYGNEGFKILTNPKDHQPLVECSFAFPFDTICNIPVIYCGKIDTAVANNDGDWSFDHKTTFHYGEIFDCQMQEDGGQLGYTWALGQALGRMPRGYIIDAVRIRRPKKADEYTGTPPVDASDFKRMPFFVDSDDIEEWMEDTRHLIGHLISAAENNYFPRCRWHCTNKYGKCDYFDVCSLPRASREHALMSNMFEDNEWTPLNQTKKENE